MRRRASVVHVVDELTRAQRRDRMRADLEALVVGVLWALWSVRVELLLALGLVAVQRATATVVGEVAGVLVAALVLAAALSIRRARRAILAVLHAMSVRRAWARATIDSGVATGPF